jgi:hypothetical protein
MSKLIEAELRKRAQAVLDEHGLKVGDFIASRIRELQAKEDYAGVRMWIEIAERVVRLHRPGASIDTR